MRIDRRTEIAGRNVPIESGERITIDFGGGPRPGDAGPKDFWVIFNERDADSARWRHGEDRGDRSRMMENQKGYERAWEVARTATGIRPATRQEVIKWLRATPETLESQASVRSAARLCGSCRRTTTSNLRWLSFAKTSSDSLRSTEIRQSVHRPKTPSLVGDRATGIVRPSALHGHTGVAREDGERAGCAAELDL